MAFFVLLYRQFGVTHEQFVRSGGARDHPNGTSYQLVGDAELHACVRHDSVGRDGLEVTMLRFLRGMAAEFATARRNKRWMGGLRCGLILGILVGLCVVPFSVCIVHELDRIEVAQYEADFGQYRELATREAAQRQRHEEELGKYEATHGQQPIVGGKPRLAEPIDDSYRP